MLIDIATSGISMPQWLAAIFGTAFMLLVGVLAFFLKDVINTSKNTNDALIKLTTILDERGTKCKSEHEVVDKRLNSHSISINTLKVDVGKLQTINELGHGRNGVI